MNNNTSIFFNDSSQGYKGAEQSQYLLGLAICGLMLTGFSASTFGWEALVHVSLAAAVSFIVEVVFSLVRKKPVTGSGMIYGMVLALLVPPTIPYWILILGAIFGTLFGKEVFGGAKNAIFNPALVGLGFMFFSYPSNTLGISVGNLGILEGNAWQNSIWLLIACLAIQVFVRPSSLNIYIPMFAIAYTMAACVIPPAHLPMEGNLPQIFANDNFMLIGILLAVDPGNTPRRWPGKIIYGLLLGLLSILMRCFSKYSDAMMFAVLVVNCIAPMFDVLFPVKADKEAAK